MKYTVIAAVPRQCGRRRSNKATLMIDSKLKRRDFCDENGMPDLQKLVACFGGYNKITPEAWAQGMKPTKLINNNYEGAHEHKGRCHTEAREPWHRNVAGPMAR